MNFLIDANLPPRLCAWLKSRGHVAEHLVDLKLLKAMIRKCGATPQCKTSPLSAKMSIFTIARCFSVRDRRSSMCLWGIVVTLDFFRFSPANGITSNERCHPDRASLQLLRRNWKYLINAVSRRPCSRSDYISTQVHRLARTRQARGLRYRVAPQLHRRLTGKDNHSRIRTLYSVPRVFRRDILERFRVCDDRRASHLLKEA